MREAGGASVEQTAEGDYPHHKVFFIPTDRRPVSREDVERAKRYLRYAFDDLKAVARSLPDLAGAWQPDRNRPAGRHPPPVLWRP